MLRKGMTNSGSFTSDKSRGNKFSQTHGFSYSKLYAIWHRIKDRCKGYNKTHKKYYFDRNISVCEEWLNFLPFQKWALTHGYKQGLTIDRIDNDGNYEPSNCRWATPKEQANNKRNTIRVKYKDQLKTLHEWADELNIPYHVLFKRHKAGWNVTRIIMTPLIQNKSHKKFQVEI